MTCNDSAMTCATTDPTIWNKQQFGSIANGSLQQHGRSPSSRVQGFYALRPRVIHTHARPAPVANLPGTFLISISMRCAREWYTHALGRTGGSAAARSSAGLNSARCGPGFLL